MCLTIPMRVERVEGLTAHCVARGVLREVSLFLMQHETVAPGDHLLVHLGEAHEKMNAEDAAATWALYDEIFACEAPATGG
ncbi:HypC/HybG/HupF family hydrogenase formation chaperone [Acidimangrovimonas sediminis]|uniref:HypC/HybG/HupF family hydrogenase formation chaperone n=1 Tax=Acidimangrovimonas sediminis TaxID=2056283 RepID=UPI000C80AD5A|nr:HypC/HybG/HupF family hydrogenase formation chaperone [Acidimangrovimonas sediminis]